MTMRTICGHSAKNRFRSVARSGIRAIAPSPSLLGSTLCWEGNPETRPMVAPMPQREIRFRTTTPVPTHTEVDHQALVARFAAIRGELKVPGDFPPDVEAEAERAARDVALPDRDETDVPFVTVDPVGSMDLDQALHLQRVGAGTGCGMPSPTCPRTSPPAECSTSRRTAGSRRSTRPTSAHRCTRG
jgi:hypothetical protein